MAIKNDNVNHPKHYTAHPSGIECIEINEHMTGNIASAFKYVWRSGLKVNHVEDLKKAIWYLEREHGRRLLNSNPIIGPSTMDVSHVRRMMVRVLRHETGNKREALGEIWNAFQSTSKYTTACIHAVAHIKCMISDILGVSNGN